ncbi:hypothetical protein SAMN05519104_0948 [Rhizobiales bacterium GAS188]|nr:hypothetical protein SAMN05519104_0948 [Rhizobiales bacterium GAS188]
MFVLWVPVPLEQGASGGNEQDCEDRAEKLNHPGQIRHVDGEMYEAMKRAFLKILPETSPGLTMAEVQEYVLAHLPEDLFPGGAKAGWWTKAVQLDLAARGVVAREKTRPLRLRKA